MDESQYITMLQNTVANTPGFLKIITNEISPELRVDAADPRSPLRDDLLATDADILKRPGTFVLHDVITIEPHPAQETIYRAITTEGDFCEGRPQDLWVRLIDHTR